MGGMLCNRKMPQVLWQGLLAGLFWLVSSSQIVLADDRELVFAMITPPQHQWTLAAQAAADDVLTASAGGLSIRVLPGGQRGNDAAVLAQVADGALDGALVTGAMFSAYAPWLRDLMTPGMAKNLPEAQRFLFAATKQYVGADHGPYRVIGLGAGGLRHQLYTPGIEWLDKPAGRTVRIPAGGGLESLYRAIGAEPLALPLPATRRALNAHLVDILDMDIEMIVLGGYASPGMTLIRSGHMIFPVVAVMSAKAYAALSETRQRLVERSFCRQLVQLPMTYQALEEGWVAGLKANGVTVVDGRPGWLAESMRQYPVAAWLRKFQAGEIPFPEEAICP